MHQEANTLEKRTRGARCGKFLAMAIFYSPG